MLDVLNLQADHVQVPEILDPEWFVWVYNCQHLPNLGQGHYSCPCYCLHHYHFILNSLLLETRKMEALMRLIVLEE